MTPNNFKWYLHALLFSYTQWVIKRQMAKVEEEDEDEDDEDDWIDIEDEE
jgi:hypothetical protein